MQRQKGSAQRKIRNLRDTANEKTARIFSSLKLAYIPVCNQKEGFITRPTGPSYLVIRIELIEARTYRIRYHFLGKFVFIVLLLVHSMINRSPRMSLIHQNVKAALHRCLPGEGGG